MTTPADIRRLYETEKLSTRAIAARLGLHKETVRLVLRKAGVPMRSKIDAALLRDRGAEWTDDRLRLLRELWLGGATCGEIKRQTGISYGVRAISAKAKALGLPPRREPRARPATLVRNARPAVAEEPVARAVFVDRSLISFWPENPRVQMMFEQCMAKVRAERGAA